MEEVLIPLLLIGLMIGISAWLIHSISRQPSVRVVVLLSLTGPDAPEVTLRQAFSTLAGLPYSPTVTVALLEEGEMDEICLQRQALQRRYPEIDFVTAVELLQLFKA